MTEKVLRCKLWDKIDQSLWECWLNGKWIKARLRYLKCRMQYNPAFPGVKLHDSGEKYLRWGGKRGNHSLQ